EGSKREFAFEQEKIGAAREPAFKVEIEPSERGGGDVMQAAAMRRIDAKRAGRGEPRIGAALGAVAVDDIGFAFTRPCRDQAVGSEIGRAEMPAHRRAMD